MSSAADQTPNPPQGAAARKRKEENRKTRVEERKAKRHAKAEAKRARKANNRPAAKWTAEHRVGMKAEQAKARAKTPKQVERQRDRLLQRSHKLEAEAAKLLVKARKAAAQYQAMVDADKKRQAEGKSGEEGNAAEPYDLPVDSDEDDSDTSSEGSDDTSASDDGGAPVAEVPMPKTVPADEIIMKKRRESDAASVHSVKGLVEIKPKKEKKAKNNTPDSEEAQPETKKAKKDQKRKSEVAPDVSEEEEEEEPETKRKEKSEKKRKRESTASKEETPAEDAEHPKKKEKKEKKEKKGKKGKRDKKSEETTEAKAPADENEATWNVGQLDGGAARQAKMLRLLGGKKTGGAVLDSAGSTGKPKNSLDSVKAEADLQRQFEDGMRAKNEGGGHRRGLGA